MKKILEKIQPSQEDEQKLKKTVEKIKTKILEFEYNFPIEIELVGSVAKGTYLKNPDIDIFLLFPPEISRKEMEHMGLKIGKKVIPEGREKYAELPYINGIFDDFEIDIVPAYKIEDSSKKISAVDRTPFHTKFIKQNLKHNQKNEVRLLKQFMKGIGVYGAEAKIEGFSGYLTELLILKYGSFLDVLKSASDWKSRTTLYISQIKNSENLLELFPQPLIFIDPVDGNRNVASALSRNRYSMFIYAAKEYLKNPSDKFFFPKQMEIMDIEEIRKKLDSRKTYFIVVDAPKPDVVNDTLYPQINKFSNTIQRILDEEFLVFNIFYTLSEKISIFVELKHKKTSAMKKHEGPPVWHTNSEDFIKKWKHKAERKPYIEKGRWWIEYKRKELTANEYLYEHLESHNIGKNINKKEIEINDLIKNIKKEYVDVLTQFLDNKMPWER